MVGPQRENLLLAWGKYITTFQAKIYATKVYKAEK
jgi:hypothetical protein